MLPSSNAGAGDQRTLSRLTSAELEQLGQHGVVEHFTAGDILYRRAPEALYVIEGGAIFLFQHHERAGEFPHMVLRRFQIFGEAAIRGGHERHDGQPQHICPPTTAEAVTDVRVRVLQSEEFEAAAAALPGLRTVVDAAVTLRRLAGPFLAAARVSPLYRSLSASALLDLFGEAELIDPAAAVADGVAPGVYFLPAAETRPGLVEGDILLHCLGAPEDIRAATDMLGRTGAPAIVRISLDRYRGLLTTNPTLRRSIAATPQLAQVLYPTTEWEPVEVVLMTSTLPAPLSSLTKLLAQTLASRHRDRILVLKLVSEPARRFDPAKLAGDGPFRVVFGKASVSGSGSLAAQVETVLQACRGRVDYLFLDPEPSLRDRVFDELSPLLTKLVHLTDDVRQEFPVGMNAAGFSHRVVLSLLPGVSSASYAAPEFNPEFPRGTVRLSLDLSRFRDGDAGNPRLADLTRETVDSFERWARAVSDRRVGVALGGGGVWGFAHIPLLRALLDAEVPIDMISGVSFGSLVGAYFCAEQRGGLERLLSSTSSLSRAVQGSILFPRLLSAFIDGELGRRRLEQLTMPLFPVATEIRSATEYVINSGTLGYGVRASGAAPFIFRPVIEPGRRLLDGGVVNNVPESTLSARGANLVIASNVLGEIPTEPDRQSWLPFDLGFRNRSQDLVRSLLVLVRDGGAHDASSADEVFTPALAQGNLVDFARGPEIVRAAEPAAHAVAERVSRRWQQLAGIGRAR